MQRLQRTGARPDHGHIGSEHIDAVDRARLVDLEADETDDESSLIPPSRWVHVQLGADRGQPTGAEWPIGLSFMTWTRIGLAGVGKKYDPSQHPGPDLAAPEAARSVPGNRGLFEERKRKHPAKNGAINSRSLRLRWAARVITREAEDRALVTACLILKTEPSLAVRRFLR